MPFSQEIINHIAHLARLDIQNMEQGNSIQENLTRIVAMVDEISEANTEGVQPMAHPLDMIQRLREDSITEFNERDTLIALAPLAEAGLFLVPKVLDTLE